MQRAPSGALFFAGAARSRVNTGRAIAAASSNAEPRHGTQEHHLWYDNGALDAATFYASILPDSAVTAVHHAPGDYPDGKEGNVLTVEFTVCGIPCVGLNGGPAFKHSEAFSFQIQTEDQAETDRLWNAIVGNGGQESQCGWSKRAFNAMMPMKKIDIATIEAAIKKGDGGD
jgi:2-polyprenyl-6-hydroxyphenyl methylase/3-demethylubiquinone-9 3-methyltransferase